MLGIHDRLAKADDVNARSQRDLAMSNGRVAHVLARQGEHERARASFRQGRAIIERLKALRPEIAILPEDLAWFDAQLAALRK